MAKRTRGSVRPGQRQPLRRTARPTGSPASPTPAGAPDPGLTAADEARAAELEARIVAEERAAAATSSRTRDRSQSSSPSPRPNRRGGSMAVRYADEYAYVARDLRRIGVVSALLLGILAALFIAVQVLGIGI